MDHSKLVTCAIDAAAAAAAVHERYLGKVDVRDWAEKGAADFVTHVDREAEAAISRCILSAFPDHAIMAEESSTAGAGPDWVAPSASRGWTWVVDPLDGTTNYLHGYPMYGVSIAVMLDGVLQAGTVRNTVTGEVWHATRGGGAWRTEARGDRERAQVSAIDNPRRALIGTGFPFKALSLLPRYLEQFDRVLRNTAGIRRAGSAALDLCHVASGMFDGFWELSLQPWDIAAGALIVREAGGICTTVDGSEDVVATGSVMAGNSAIHAALMQIVHTDGIRTDGDTAKEKHQ
jgi:myo-inositol-1(or 4)-monophosphatase